MSKKIVCTFDEICMCRNKEQQDYDHKQQNTKELKDNKNELVPKY